MVVNNQKIIKFAPVVELTNYSLLDKSHSYPTPERQFDATCYNGGHPYGQFAGVGGTPTRNCPPQRSRSSTGDTPARNCSCLCVK